MNTDSTPSASAISGPLVVLDAPARSREIYGHAFDRLGQTALHPANLDPDAFLALYPAEIFLSSEWTHEWRLISAAARRAGIPVIYVMDGVIEWSYLWNNLSFIRPWGTMLQPLLASDLCVIGRHPARILASMGLAERTHLVGLPRFDGVPRDRIVQAGRRPRILVATARTAGHDVEQQVLARRALRDLHAWFKTQPAIDVVWRIAADLAEDIGVQADINGAFADVLATSDGLISFTSTCLLEGMHKGIPVAQLDYRAVPLYVATAWEIRCADHIPSVVQELIHPPTQKLAWQDACYADELEAGDANGALANAIREILARPRATEATAPAAPSTPVAPSAQPTGRLDFRQVHSELSAFAIGSNSVLQYELSASHNLLRHTRHEKGFLQRECIELVEAVTGDDIAGLRTFSMLNQFASAGRQGDVAIDFVAIRSRAVRALVTTAPAEGRFSVPTGLPGRLSLAVSVHPDCWSRAEAASCRLVIFADELLLLDATLDLYNAPDDQKWWWFDYEVPASKSGAHSFLFQAIGPDGARAVWRNPVFRWKEDGAQANASFLPRLAAGAAFYVPGRTIA